MSLGVTYEMVEEKGGQASLLGLELVTKEEKILPPLDTGTRNISRTTKHLAILPATHSLGLDKRTTTITKMAVTTSSKNCAGNSKITKGLGTTHLAIIEIAITMAILVENQMVSADISRETHEERKPMFWIGFADRRKAKAEPMMTPLTRKIPFKLPEWARLTITARAEHQ